MWRENPRNLERYLYRNLSKLTSSGIRKWPGADGIYREERELKDFPRAIFSDYLVLDRELVEKGNAWTYQNRKKLPEDLFDLNFRHLYLTVNSNEDFSRLSWVIKLLPGGPRIGDGRVAFVGQSWVTTLAQIALQGFRLYPAVLEILTELVGYIHSSKAPSPGAIKAWQRSGAHYDYDSGRYIKDA